MQHHSNSSIYVLTLWVYSNNCVTRSQRVNRGISSIYPAYEYNSSNMYADPLGVLELLRHQAPTSYFCCLYAHILPLFVTQKHFVIHKKNSNSYCNPSNIHADSIGFIVYCCTRPQRINFIEVWFLQGDSWNCRPNKASHAYILHIRDYKTYISPTHNYYIIRIIYILTK